MQIDLQVPNFIKKLSGLNVSNQHGPQIAAAYAVGNESQP
jgi:hypothetical protein